MGGCEGGLPTLAEYCDWATAREGCSVDVTPIQDSDGDRSGSLTRIERPAAGWHVLIASHANEELSQSVVDHLDRRLGVISPWNSGRNLPLSGD